MNRLIFLYASVVQLFALQPDKLINEIENIKYSRIEQKIVTGFHGMFDHDNNLWLSWCEHDRSPVDYQRLLYEPTQVHYSYWYVQKFDFDGNPLFPAVELEKAKKGNGTASRIYLGPKGDLYTFPGSNFTIIRVDSVGNHFIASKTYTYSEQNVFNGTNNIMYVYSTMRGLNKIISKFKIQEPLPIFVDEQKLPSRFDKEKYGSNYSNYPYNWLGSNLIHSIQGENRIIALLPLSYDDKIHHSKRKIKFYNISLPDLQLIDTLSFEIKDVLLKRIKNCPLETSVIIEAHPDTLLFFIPGKENGEKVVYVCRITKDGVPLFSSTVVEECVRDIKEIPGDSHCIIEFYGGVTGKTDEPNGIIIYGFDKSGNIYCYVWDQSDDYWRVK